MFGEPAEIIRERDAKILNDSAEGIQHQEPSKTNKKLKKHQNQAIWAKHPGTNKKNLNMANLAKQSSRKKMKDFQRHLPKPFNKNILHRYQTERIQRNIENSENREVHAASFLLHTLSVFEPLVYAAI